jgi:hypothetical protein
MHADTRYGYTCVLVSFSYLLARAFHHENQYALFASGYVSAATVDCVCLQVAAELGDGIDVLKLDVDQNADLSTRLQVGCCCCCRMD